MRHAVLGAEYGFRRGSSDLGFFEGTNVAIDYRSSRISTRSTHSAKACQAYILSQKHEGWLALPQMYDGGGISGGSLDRPALMRLLADIEAGKIDTWWSTRSTASPARSAISPRSSRCSNVITGEG